MEYLFELAKFRVLGGPDRLLRIAFLLSKVDKNDRKQTIKDILQIIDGAIYMNHGLISGLSYEHFEEIFEEIDISRGPDKRIIDSQGEGAVRVEILVRRVEDSEITFNYYPEDLVVYTKMWQIKQYWDWIKEIDPDKVGKELKFSADNMRDGLKVTNHHLKLDVKKRID